MVEEMDTDLQKNNVLSELNYMQKYNKNNSTKTRKYKNIIKSKLSFKKIGIIQTH